MRILKVAAATLVIVAFAAPWVSAQQSGARVTATIEGTLLTVSAEGAVEVAPDMATISLGVVTEAQTATQSLAENATRMSALTQALRRAGVAERDIQTSNMRVAPQYAYPAGQAPRLTGYQAQNNVRVRVPILANVGRVIDAAVSAGGNTVSGVSFGYQDPNAQIDAARRDAADAARRRAELYASSFGMRVVRIISIGESGARSPVNYEIVVTASRAGGGEQTPISPGEIRTSVSLNVTYELR